MAEPTSNLEGELSRAFSADFNSANYQGQALFPNSNAQLFILKPSWRSSKHCDQGMDLVVVLSTLCVPRHAQTMLLHLGSLVLTSRPSRACLDLCWFICLKSRLKPWVYTYIIRYLKLSDAPEKLNPLLSFFMEQQVVDSYLGVSLAPSPCVLSHWRSLPIGIARVTLPRRQAPVPKCSRSLC